MTDAMGAAHKTRHQIQQEKLAAELRGAVAELSVYAARTALIDTDAYDDEIGWTRETSVAPGGEAITANVVLTDQMRMREKRPRAQMGISTFTLAQPRATTRISTVYWREGSQAASITTREEGDKPIAYSAHATNEADAMQPGDELAEITDLHQTLELVGRALYAVGAFNRHVPPLSQVSR